MSKQNGPDSCKDTVREVQLRMTGDMLMSVRLILNEFESQGGVPIDLMGDMIEIKYRLYSLQKTVEKMWLDREIDESGEIVPKQ